MTSELQRGRRETVKYMRLRDRLKQIVSGENFYLSAKDVRRIIDVDAGSFQQWLARELIPFKTVAAGNRTWRRFHVRDIPRLVLISEVLSNGLLIGEALDTVDTILNWKSKPGVSPWAVLVFRQNNIIYFATMDESLSEIFQQYDRASCILIIVDDLIRKVQHALAIAKDKYKIAERR